MTTGSRIFRNFAALSVGQVVSMTCSLIVAVILARVLGPASYGILGFGAALLSYLGLVVNMGLDVHGVRVISHDPEQTGALVGFVLIFRVIISAALFAILLGGLDYINQPEMVKIVVLIQGCGLFFVALNLDFVFQAMQQMKVMAARQIAASLMALIAVFILITSPADLYKAAGIPAAVNMVTAVVVLIIFLNSSGVRIEIRRGFSMARDLLKSSVPVALMAALNTIYVSLDIVILQFMRPQDEVGLYVVASRVLALAVVPAGILHSVFLPALSSVFDDDERRYGIARKYARTIILLGAAVGVGGTILAVPVIDVLFGEAFAGAGISSIILMVSAGMVYLTLAYGTPLLGWRRDRVYFKVLVGGAALNVVLNFALIPFYGIEGAAVATLITQSTVCLSLLLIVRSAFAINFSDLVLKSIGLAILCGMPTYFVPQIYDLPTLVDLTLSAVTFGSLFCLLAVRLQFVTVTEIKGLFS